MTMNTKEMAAEINVNNVKIVEVPSSYGYHISDGKISFIVLEFKRNEVENYYGGKLRKVLATGCDCCGNEYIMDADCEESVPGYWDGEADARVVEDPQRFIAEILNSKEIEIVC